MTRQAQIQEVIVTISLRGKGTPESLFREVTQYWSQGGTLLAESDPCAPLRYDHLSGNFVPRENEGEPTTGR